MSCTGHTQSELSKDHCLTLPAGSEESSLFIHTANVHWSPPWAQVCPLHRDTIAKGEGCGPEGLVLALFFGACSRPLSRLSYLLSSCRCALRPISPLTFVLPFSSHQPLHCSFDSSFLPQNISLYNFRNRVIFPFFFSRYLSPFPDQSKRICSPTPFTFPFRAKTGLYL